MSLIFLGDDCTNIIDGLYQGAFPNGDTSQYDLVVSLSGTHKHHAVPYIHFPFNDSPTLPNMAIIEGLAQIVADEVKAGKKVLVHCDAGLNRSGLVCALAIAKLPKRPFDHCWTLTEAVTIMRNKRDPDVLCNETFYNYVMTR